MKTHKAVLALFLAAMVAGVLAPAAALADPGRHGGARPHGGRHVVTGPGHRPGHVHQHRHFHRPFVPRVYPRFPYASPYVYGTGYYAPPVVYGVSPGYDYGSSSGYDPPVVYSPPPAPAPIATLGVAPTRPSVIEYPSGRYELRGDGISTSYVWVWIPNAPPPPAPESPPAPRVEPPPPPGTSEAPSPRPSQLYRWVDEQGVVHLTDNPESVPAQYRKPAAATAQGGA